MIPGALARRYARALIGLAKTPMQRDKFAKDLQGLSDLVKQRDENGKSILLVLSADRFTIADRKKLLGALARRVAADPMVVKFFDHVIERGRIDGLVDIARAYVKMADDVAGRVQAHVTSAAPLAPDALAKIKQALKTASGKEIVMTTAVDPELIGGVVTKVGSYVVDGSVRATLRALREELRS